MTFLLDSLREKFEFSGSGGEGFDDLNYLVGNTSGLDIGNVPSPLDQRIGRMAQIGGSIMEIEIDNPATFQIDRPELLNVISQLGFDDVTLHGDPNIGFTGAYATRGQGVTGYNVVHRYFTRYLEQMASFKREAKMEHGFDVGYVNMHASNEMIPPREEQIASDKSLDPFGNRITEINGDKKPNIYRNKEFMRLLFDFLLKAQLERYEVFQLYGFFENHSTPFENKWDKARHKEADKIYEDVTNTLDDKAHLAAVGERADPGINDRFRDEIKEIVGEESLTALRNQMNRLSIGNASEIPEAIERIKRLSEEREGLPDIDVDPEEVKEKLIDLIDDIWFFDANSDTFSYEAKVNALMNRHDYERRDIEAPAADNSIDGNRVEKWARKTFAGDEEMFKEKDWDGDTPPNLQLFRRLVQQTQIGRKMEKESTVFFNIIPAWMITADNSFEKHKGWEVPEFIWRNIVEANAPDDLNLSDFDDFQEFLDGSRENELNVIAAVGVCFLWGHFTQKESEFGSKSFQNEVTSPEGYESPELNESGNYTWIEWMNKFDLKVNLEAMFGSPGELRRVWRPKDIAIACHAINKEGRIQSEEEEWEDPYDKSLVKFTIDMEHTASYGVDPMNEIDALEEKEKRMAKNGDTDADPKKPLAEIVKTYHLTKPGWEQQQGHRHGPFARGDKTLYHWLYDLVENGFARNQEDEARIIFEVGGEYREEMYVMRVAMNMIELGIKPKDVDPSRVDPGEEYESKEEALIARFFGMDQPNFSREWAKIEEHAFDPLKGMLEADDFDYTFSSQAAVDQGGNRPNEWKNEEYR